MKPTKAMVALTVRAKAFSGEGVAVHRVMVDDANVRVWDSIAGYYTLCHSLSQASIRRIIAKAAGK